MSETNTAPEPPESDLASEPQPVPQIDPRDLEVEVLKTEAADLKDPLLRTAAEMENLRERLEREKAEATLYAASDFAKDILPVSDNPVRARDLAHADAIKDAPEPVKNLIGGVE